MEQESGTEPIKIGIVGCGWISGYHGRAAAIVPEVELLACCDTHSEAAAAFAGEFGCERHYTDLGAMLDEQELDAVLLATWPPHHREQVTRCLDAGIRAILCEKSLTTSVEDAIAIYAAVRSADALLVEGFMYRHDPTARRFFEMIHGGAVGQLDTIRAEFTAFDPEEELPEAERDWRQREDLGGGVPFDFLPYCVNACNYAAGVPPARVMAFSARSPRYGTVNRLYGLIEYQNGVVATVSSSKRGDFGFEAKATGSSGSVMLPRAWAPSAIPGEQVPEHDATELFHSRWREVFLWDTETIEVPAADHYAIQLEDFAAALRGSGQPEPSLAESVLNVATINALLESGERGVAVLVTLPDEVTSELAASRPATELSSRGPS